MALCNPGPPIRWGTCKWEAKGQGRGGRANRGQIATLVRACPRRRGPREIRGIFSSQSNLIEKFQTTLMKDNLIYH